MELFLDYATGSITTEDIATEVIEWCKEHLIELKDKEVDYLYNEDGSINMPVVGLYIELEGALLTEFILKF